MQKFNTPGQEKFPRMISLDIETTGLNPEEEILRVKNGVASEKFKPRIWAIGAEGGTVQSGVEAIFGGPTEAEKEVLSQNKFYQETHARKWLSGELGKEGVTAMSPLSALNKMVTGIFPNGTILIQNSNFERKWFEHEIKRTGEIPEFMKFLYETGTDGPGLFVPAEVTKLRREAKAAQTTAEKAKIYNDIMAVYEQQHRNILSSGPDGRVRYNVMDLMDVTRSTWLNAAGKGYIPSSYEQTGTGVEFLSKILLGEVEEHGAKSDAVQQTKIFRKLMSIRGELSTGNVSEETKRIFKVMKESEFAMKENAATKSLLSNIKRIKETGYFESSFIEGEREIVTTDRFTGEEKRIKVPKYRRTNSKYAGYRKLKEVVSAYGNTSASRIFKRVEEESGGDLDKIIRSLSNDNFISEIEEQQAGRKRIVEFLIDKTSSEEEVGEARLKADSIKANIEEEIKAEIPVKTLQEKLDETYQKIKSKNQILDELLPKNSKHGMLAIGATAIAGGVFAMSDGVDSDERTKRLQERQRALNSRQYLDPTLEQFSALDSLPPAGVGRANREQFNRSYEY